jgi:ribA/ribD-fused uncharacterized protein
MKKKQELFDPENINLATKILASDSPHQIKRYGREVNNFNDLVWEQKRYQIMVDGLLLKFSQNDRFKSLLLSTKDEVIYEAAANDRIWGIGFSAEQATVMQDTSQYGLNLLGKALMDVRLILSK